MIKDKISVLVVDDMEVAMRGLVSLIKQMNGVGNVVGVSGGKEAIQKLRQEKFDIILLDVRMPDVDGFEVCDFIKKNQPQVKTIFITFFAEVRLLFSLIKAGAKSVLFKSEATFEEIEHAIKEVGSGKTYFPSYVQNIINSNLAQSDHLRLPNLSVKDIIMIKLISEGLTSVEIADKMNLSTLTIETNRKDLLRKVNVKNSSELVKIAYKSGLLDGAKIIQ